MKKKPKQNRIDIRDVRLPGGRLTLAARTSSAVEFRAREAAVRALIDAEAWDLIEALRRRRLKLPELVSARGDLALLREKLGQRTAGKAPAKEPEPDIMTLQAQTDRLLARVKATKARNTYKQYEIICRMLIEEFGAGRMINTFRKAELEGWLHAPKKTTGDKPWSPARQRLAAAIVGRLFNVAIDAEEEAADQEGRESRIRRNPTKKIEIAKDRKGRVEFLRPAEWRVLTEKAKDTPVHALLALGTLAGLRIGEAAHLRMDIDVVLTGAKPYINVQPRGGEYPWDPKTKRSLRKVPIGSELLRILHRHVEMGYAGKRYLIISRPERDWPMNRQVLQRWTGAAFKAAGINYGRKQDALTYHSLRHTFISWLVQNDVSLKKIEQLAGTSVKMILDVYGHLLDENLEGAINIVDTMARKGS